MATAVRTLERWPGALYEHDEVLEEFLREQREELEPRPRELCVSLTSTGAVEVDLSEIDAISDGSWGGGTGTAMLDIADATEPIVLSICGRERRLRVR